MTGNKMRPLRLVKEAEQEQKLANRVSWIPQNVAGWFNKGDAGANGPGHTPTGSQ